MLEYFINTSYRNYVSLVGGYGRENDFDLEFVIQVAEIALDKLMAAPLTNQITIADTLPQEEGLPGFATPTTGSGDAPSDRIILSVTTDKNAFHCIAADGPATLKITAQISDIDLGMTIFWRLQDKATLNTTPWETAVMRRDTGSNRSFTFNADVTAGTNNFFYPPGYGESWFQFQIVESRNAERTEIFSDVTFYPCAN